METKTIASNIATAVATAVIMGVLAWAGGMFQKGTEAGTKELIREVLLEEMKTDEDITYGQALTKIGLDINTVQTRVEALKEDVDDLEDAVLTLAGGN